MSEEFDDGLGNPEDLYEVQLTKLIRISEIPDEVFAVLGNLDLAAIAAAGGIADHLEQLIAARKEELRSEIRATATEKNLVIGEESVTNIMKEMEPSIPELVQLQSTLVFVKKHEGK